MDHIDLDADRGKVDVNHGKLARIEESLPPLAATSIWAMANSMRTAKGLPRPKGITALSVFFAFGAAMALTSFVALLFPGGFLEPMWRLNPRAREAFGSMGGWALLLMAAVGVACAFAAFGLWRGRRWGYILALVILSVNLIGDLTNALLGIEPRAWFGVPVAALILWFLATPRVRTFFAGSSLTASSVDG